LGENLVFGKLFAILACSILLQTYPALAQNNPSSSAGTPGCGDPKIKFDVKTRNSGSVAKPDPGKATVYFIEDDKNFNSIPKPTTRLGIDGEWAGATHGNSYFSVSVNPGVHHLCASVVRQADCRLFRDARARLTFSRMSAALAVQMKGFG
jgi:hypothetical protein